MRCLPAVLVALLLLVAAPSVDAATPKGGPSIPFVVKTLEHEIWTAAAQRGSGSASLAKVERHRGIRNVTLEYVAGAGPFAAFGGYRLHVEDDARGVRAIDLEEFDTDTAFVPGHAYPSPGEYKLQIARQSPLRARSTQNRNRWLATEGVYLTTAARERPVPLGSVLHRATAIIRRAQVHAFVVPRTLLGEPAPAALTFKGQAAPITLYYDGRDDEVTPGSLLPAGPPAGYYTIPGPIISLVVSPDGSNVTIELATALRYCYGEYAIPNPDQTTTPIEPDGTFSAEVTGPSGVDPETVAGRFVGQAVAGTIQNPEAGCGGHDEFTASTAA